MTGTASESGAVAIIGMSCLFPGSDGLSSYWANICAGREMVDVAPPEWGAARYLGSANSNEIGTDRGGFLRDLYRFDPVDMGVMPSSVDGSEPDQFIALRLAKAALADAGYDDLRHDHARTGIILGHSTYLHRGNAGVVQHGIVLDQTISLVRQLIPDADEQALNELREALQSKLPPFNPDMAPGLVPNVMTGRIANRLDLKGPNYLIDAACASSLLAVGAAMGELRGRRSDLMLAGGVNASISAEVNMVFTQLGALSKTGKVRPFDETGDGTLLGEGAGVVVLKRLEDALADGDRVYAVLRGIGQASDGRGTGLLAPRLEGEVLAIRRAYEEAEIEPGAGVGLIEAHGTGIPLGDRTEISALSEVFPPRANGIPSCAIGSVKSMIGHCIPAAGIAGLIKAALALHHRTLPPSLCGTVRAETGIAATPLYVNTAAMPWVQAPERPRRAGVNAFGFGGINTHAVLEEAPAAVPDRSPVEWPHELLVLSAATAPELAARVRALREAVAARPRARLADIAATLARGAGEGDFRLAIVAASPGDLIGKLDKAVEQIASGRGRFQMRSGVFASDERIGGKVAFVFPGEGSQYQNMVREVLTAFPEARRWFDFWDGIYGESRSFLPSRSVFPPSTTLEPEVASMLQRELHGLEIGSESVFIASQCLLAVTRGLGLHPDAILGHSSGEHSALTAAGVIGDGDMAGLKDRILDLNRLYRAMDDAGEVDRGALLTVGAVPRERILEIVDDSEVHLALDNCRHQSVLYGSEPRMQEIAEKLGAEGGLCSFLPFGRPYHTTMFASVARMVEKVYSEMRFRSPSVPLYSCATAAPMPEDADEITRLAARQWQSRVRFVETVERMYEDGVRVFLEVGPSAHLTGFIGDILKGRELLALPLDSRRGSSLTQLLQSIGRLWIGGVAVDLPALFAGREVTTIDLDGEPPVDRARVFSNLLPIIQLDEAEAERLRTRVAPTAAASHVPAGAASPGTAAPAPAPVSFEFPAPLHFLHRIMVHEPDRFVAECDLDLATDRFLADHVLYATEISDLDADACGLPVLPLAVSLEMMAEAATALGPGLIPVRFERVRALDWVAVEEGQATLTLEARRLADAPGVRSATRILRGDAVLIEAEVVLATEPEDTGFRLPPLVNPQPPVWRDEDLYSTGMFHGPLFHSISRLEAWDDGGLDAELAPTPLDDFSAEDAPTTLLLNPVLLDAIGHVTAFWIAQGFGTDFSSFPSSIERIDLIDARREETGGCRIGGRLGFEGDGQGGPRYLRGDFACTDALGRPLFVVRGWRDRFFNVPHSFYYARYRPRDGWYGEEFGQLFEGLPSGSVVWSVPSFPEGFLTDAGGIWRRVLARTVLAHEERAELEALPPRAAIWDDWLTGRIALKEAARLWIARNCGTLLLPADLVVATTPSGMPYIVEDGLEELGGMPQIAVTRQGGRALAFAASREDPCGADDLLAEVAAALEALTPEQAGSSAAARAAGE